MGPVVAHGATRKGETMGLGYRVYEFPEKGSGRWRYQLHFRGDDGTLHRDSGMSDRGHTRTAATTAALDHIARIKRPTTAEERADSPTFAKVAAALMEHLDTHPEVNKPSEVDGKRQKLVYLNEWIGDRRIGEITRVDIDRVRKTLAKEKLSLSTTNNYLSVIGAVLDYAVEREIVDSRPSLGIKRPENTLTREDIYTEAEVAPLLAEHAGDVMASCALLLGFDAGLRAGEIRALARIDIVGDVIHVRHAEYAGNYKLKPKSGYGRRVAMTERLAETVRAALASHAAPSVLIRRGGPGRWARFEGMPWTKESMRGFAPAKGWHALRHGFCTRLAESGVPAAEIMAVAGHATLKTSERYIQLDFDKVAACTSALNAGRGTRARIVETPRPVRVVETPAPARASHRVVSPDEARAVLKGGQVEVAREYQRQLMRERRTGVRAPEKACPRCGKSIVARNLARHLWTAHNVANPRAIVASDSGGAS
jgi:integrase